jgi:hypothetical protein
LRGYSYLEENFSLIPDPSPACGRREFYAAMQFTGDFMKGKGLNSLLPQAGELGMRVCYIKSTLATAWPTSTIIPIKIVASQLHWIRVSDDVFSFFREDLRPVT